LKRRLN